MFVSLALTQPIIAAALVIAIGLATMHDWRWRSLMATRLYLEQCDVALEHPEFSNPEGQLDMRARTHKAGERAFEQYEWYVARLVYVLDECLSLMPFGRWNWIAHAQLANHRQYLASDYYAKQNYLPHYSRTMQRLIERQRKDA